MVEKSVKMCDSCMEIGEETISNFKCHICGVDICSSHKYSETGREITIAFSIKLGYPNMYEALYEDGQSKKESSSGRDFKIGIDDVIYCSACKDKFEAKFAKVALDVEKRLHDELADICSKYASEMKDENWKDLEDIKISVKEDTEKRFIVNRNIGSNGKKDNKKVSIKMGTPDRVAGPGDIDDPMDIYLV